MRKHAVVWGALAVMAALLFSVAVAGAAVTINPTKLGSGVKPPHVNKAPFKWTDSGTLSLPAVVCPAGATVLAYCSAPPADSCGGTVQITVTRAPNKYLGLTEKTLKTFTTSLTSGCTYSGTTTIAKSAFTTSKKVKAGTKGSFANVKFAAVFLGNTTSDATVSPVHAAVQTVLAKLQSTYKKPRQ